MKKLVLVLVAVLAFNLSNAQKVATYEQVVNKTVKGNLQTYISKAGEKFTVGDEITIGLPTNGNYSNLVPGFGYVGSTPIVGETLIIEKLYSYNKFLTIKAKGKTFKLGTTELEAALANNEIESKLMTRGDAIAKLKESKGLLDLGLIDKGEYDSIKNDLTPIIMN